MTLAFQITAYLQTNRSSVWVFQRYKSIHINYSVKMLMYVPGCPSTTLFLELMLLVAVCFCGSFILTCFLPTKSNFFISTASLEIFEPLSVFC